MAAGNSVKRFYWIFKTLSFLHKVISLGKLAILLYDKDS